MEEAKITKGADVVEDVSFSEEATDETITVKPKETVLSKLVITILGIPLNLLFGWLITPFANMDMPTWLSKFWGYKTKKCRYCGRQFNSVSYFCKQSPTQHHRE